MSDTTELACHQPEPHPGVRVLNFTTPEDGPVMTMDDLNEHVAGLLNDAPAAAAGRDAAGGVDD